MSRNVRSLMESSRGVMVQQQYTNHIGFMIDGSSSMSPHEESVIAVVDAQIERLKQTSVAMNQETRISIYIFRDTVECKVFDMDVMRFKSLRGYYKTSGMTALIDAFLTGIKDHGYLPQMYGDHGFLMFAVTDGQNNINDSRYVVLRNSIATLPENWTVACLVPDAVSKQSAKRFGFPDGAIALWNANDFTEAGSAFETAMDSYMMMRSTGVRSTKGLFTLNTTGIRKSALKPLDASLYDLLPVRSTNRYTQIREFVEKWTKEPYRLGSAYYEPTKPVEIQHHKNVLLQDRKTGRVYEGAHLRELLGLPAATVKVNPGDHKDYRVFVQSTSVNRKPIVDTFILVRK